jgi:tetratricopeptide (TPR) repeat protein
MRSLRLLTLALLAITLISCGRDPNYLKQQYLTSGNRYYDKGRYKEASIMYRRAIEQDRKWGPGYYHLSLTFLKQGAIPSAVGTLRRAVELLPKGGADYNDASLKLGEILVVASQSVEKNEQIC